MISLPANRIPDVAEVTQLRAQNFSALDACPKPRLLIEGHNPDTTLAALRDILADAGELYDRGVPVRLCEEQTTGATVAQQMTAAGVVRVTHGVCRPYEVREIFGKPCDVDVRLPNYLAVMYLDWRGEWGLRPLDGIASVAVLREDGSIYSTAGYDPVSRLFLENVPDVDKLLPERPTRAQAEAALAKLREQFQTFCFADARTLNDRGVAVVDTSLPPEKDESAFLVALLTAVCRPSLPLAPGVLVRAPETSGAGAGKGLLARCICIIAFGHEPHAVTGGATAEELEKRIAAELMQGSPCLFLDNLNGRSW
jgi:hypothetical protein